MKTYRITYFDSGLKEKDITVYNLYEIINQACDQGIYEWSITKIELVPEKLQ